MEANEQTDEDDFINSERNAVQFKVGKSVLNQFIKTHNYLDCVIEAIQNDFDARSPEICFFFSEKDLTIIGKGESVDEDGWNRLTYSLGYNSPRERKIGTIGNKNQGVRSYLLFGDMVIFRSGGKKILITPDGSSQKQKEDNSTKSKKGVTITISLRDSDSSEGLPKFSINEEQQLIETLSSALPGMVSQLQIKGWEKVLEKVKFVFARSNTCIELTQQVPSISDCEGFTEYHRTGKMAVYALDTSKPCFLHEKQTSLEQVEYVETIPLPPELIHDNIPKFFLREETKDVAIGLSFMLNQSRPSLQTGHLYYPLELAHVKTGNSLSVNAPFELDSSRQGLVAIDQLNKALVENVAELVGQLFRKVLIRKYGPLAYRLLLPQGDDGDLGFYKRAIASLKKYKAIINNTYSDSADFSEEFFCKEDCILPRTDDLYDFIKDARREVSRTISDPLVKAFFVEDLGAKYFDIHDVAALWSNDNLSPAEEGAWHYRSRGTFAKAFSEISVQQKYADAFASHQNELSPDEIEKIKRSVSTLDSTPLTNPVETRLNAAAKMRLWSHDAQNVPSLDLHYIINSQTANHPFFIIVLKIPEFEVNDYIQRVLVPAVNSMRPEDKIRASVFLLKNVKELSAQSVSALKNVEIFRSSTELWSTFDQIVDGNTALTKAFGDSMLYLHPTLLNDDFRKVFTFRKNPHDEEIEKRVNELWQKRGAISQQTVLDFEEYLKSRKLTLDLKERICNRVLTIDTKGRIWPVSGCYESTSRLRALLGPEAHYVDFSNDDHFKRLGAHVHPRFSDMLDYIFQMRTTGGKPQSIVKFYRELADAKKRDGVTNSHDQDDIILIGERFVPPSKLLIHPNYRKHFFESMFYWDQGLDSEGLTKSALLCLGCKERPGQQEFLNLLRWISDQVGQGKPLTDTWRSIAQWAYPQFPASGLPQDATPDDRILLTTRRDFTSLEAAKNSRIFYNDSEEFATALADICPEIAFFDCGQRGHSFFQSLDVPKLTSFVTHLKDSIGKEEEPSSDLEQMFERLRSKETINGIQCYIEQNQQLVKARRSGGIDEIISLKKMKRATDICSLYEFKEFERPLQITRGARIVGDTIYVSSALEAKSVSLEISKAVSEEIVDSRDAQSSVTLAINAFLTGLDVRKFLASQNYSYQESIDVPILDQKVESGEAQTQQPIETRIFVTPEGSVTESEKDFGESSTTEAEPIKANLKESHQKKVKLLDELEIEDQRSAENTTQLKEEAKEAFLGKDAKPIDLSGTFRPGVEITGAVVSSPKYVVYNEKKPIAGLNLHPIRVGNEIVLVSPGLAVPGEKEVQKFLVLLRKIIQSMGGNPDTVKIIVTNETTEARELLPNYPGQIGFNVMLSDRSPIFWLIIVARELASLKYKRHFPHVKAMALYMERALYNLIKIDPEFFNTERNSLK